jgi:hypothetical protein
MRVSFPVRLSGSVSCSVGTLHKFRGRKLSDLKKKLLKYRTRVPRNTDFVDCEIAGSVEGGRL